MKTRMLKKLRKWAVLNIYVTRKTGGYVVWHQCPFRENVGEFEELKEAKRYCDTLRRQYVIKMLDNYRAKKKRRVY